MAGRDTRRFVRSGDDGSRQDKVLWPDEILPSIRQRVYIFYEFLEPTMIRRVLLQKRDHRVQRHHGSAVCPPLLLSLQGGQAGYTRVHLL